MPVVDADTHVDENEDTWAYLDPAAARFKPTTVLPAGDGPGGTRPGYNRYWLVDGRLRVRRVRDDVRTGTTQATRELHDVPARLRHMDELGVDVQVLYPTLFLSGLTHRPEVERALCLSYNRWLAERCAQSGGRLRWVAVLPLLDMDAALAELQFAYDHGACGVLKKGLESGGRPASDPYFFPLYEESARRNLPICLHLGSGDSEAQETGPGAAAGLIRSTFPVLDAFYNLVLDGVPNRFPSLRFGFIEAGATWVGYLLTLLTARRERMAWAGTFELKQDLFRESRFYVACQTVDDLPYVLRFGTEDNLVIGTDYSHADASAEIRSLEMLKAKAAEGELTAPIADKILAANPSRLYGL